MRAWYTHQTLPLGVFPHTFPFMCVQAKCVCMRVCVFLCVPSDQRQAGGINRPSFLQLHPAMTQRRGQQTDRPIRERGRQLVILCVELGKVGGGGLLLCQRPLLYHHHQFLFALNSHFTMLPFSRIS